MLYILIVLGIVLLESRIKKYIDDNRRLGEKEEILNGRVILKKQYNRGMFLNCMENSAKTVKIISGALLGVLLIAFAVLLPKKNRKMLKLGLSLCIGGAISNTADRFTKGHVVDYFSFNCKCLRSVVFNLADMFILAGSLIMAVSSLFSSGSGCDIDQTIE